MGVTDLGHPFPEGPDDVDVPGDIEALAQSVDAKTYVRDSKRCSVDAEQTRSAGTFGVLGTPDRVEDLDVPAGGLVAVFFSALAKMDSSNVGEAAIFFNEDQLKVPHMGGAPQGSFARFDGGLVGNKWRWVISDPRGLRGGPFTETSVSDAVTTPMALAFRDDEADADLRAGGLCIVRVPIAGSYDISVRWRVTPAGVLSAKERKLWAMVVASKAPA